MKRGDKVQSPCPWQDDYFYELAEPIGKNFHEEFTPELTPAEMLKLGIFGGHYFEGHIEEFPKSWFNGARLSSANKKEAHLNCFGVNASQPLDVWERKGWISKYDPHGWFQWYCRYYLGRRLPEEDLRQIKRWKAIRRHVAQIQHNCMKGDLLCRPRQRQAVLHWGYDSRKL